MSKYAEVAAMVDRLLVPYRPLIDAVDKLKELGSLESQAEFLERKVAESAATLAQLEPKVKQAQADLTEAHEHAMRIIAQAEETAAGVRELSDQQAAETMDRAKAEAAEVKRQAEDHAKTVRAAAEHDRNAMAAVLRKAKKDIAEAEKARDALRAELESLSGQVEKARRIAAAVG